LVKSQKTKKVAADAVAFLEVLSAAGVILTAENEVIDQSEQAKQMGLVAYGKLINSELQELVNQARAERTSKSTEVYFAPNLRAAKQFLFARATMLSEELVILMVEDRTEAKRLEDVRHDFVENISHELKTPISAISLLSEALQIAVEDPAAVKKFAVDLNKESKRLASGEIRKVDLGNLIAEAVDSNLFLADRRNVKLSFDVVPEVYVKGDSELLTMAIKNLIENAILYSEANSQVGVGLKVESGMAEITVTDNGIGIPVDQQERIFERFYRVDPSRSRETGGTGLGLAIVKHAANNHGGEVTVFSRVGLGSTFTLRLPLMTERDQND